MLPVISIVSDFILAGFPIIILREVQIHTRRKVFLCFLMSLGLLTAACCIVRTILNWQNDHADQTWVAVDNYIWRCVEVNIGIIAPCIPTLMPLFRLLHDELAAVRHGYTSKKAHLVPHASNQGCGTHSSSQEPISKSRKDEDDIPLPRNAEWVSPISHAFTRAGKAGKEDIEMQALCMDASR